MAFKAIPLLKFVGTVSLGLLTGVSYTVSRFALPSLLQLPSSGAAADTLAHLVASLQTPLLALSSLAAAPFALAFALAPRHARHPYLLYASLLAGLSAVAPRYLKPAAPATATTTTTAQSRPAAARAKMEASYEVLGDSHSESTSGEDLEEAGVNGEDVRIFVQGLSRAYAVQAGLAAVGFAMSVVGLWGDGAPTTIIVS